MLRDTVRKYYVLHSWLGAATAILLFVICFTGAVSVFGTPEIKIWANPGIQGHRQIPSEAIEALLQTHAEELGPDYLHEVSVIFPAVRSKPTLVLVFETDKTLEDGSHQHYAIHYHYDPRTLALQKVIEGTPGEIFEQRDRDLADFLIAFHADLHLGNPWGLVITGLLGLTLLASVITGIVIHKKILRELLVFRPRRSLRLFWTDTHKVAGVWGLLFHATIGFTGAFLGLAAVVLVPAAALVSFGGDREALVAAVLPDIEPELSGEEGPLQLARVLEAARQDDNGTIISVSLVGWRDREAILIVNTLPNEGLEQRMLEYHAATAEYRTYHTTFGKLEGVTGPVMDLMVPLHFGHFGGLLVKTIWAVLGLSTALVAVSGMMIWIERRAYGPTGRLSERSYLRISRFTVGACSGLVLAVIALFYGQRLLPVAPQRMGVALGQLYFSVWIISALWAMSRRNEYVAARQLLCVAGLFAAAVPLLSAFTTANHIFNVQHNGHWIAAAVDTCLMLLGIALLLCGWRLPTERPLRKKHSQIETAHPDAAGLEH